MVTQNFQGNALRAYRFLKSHNSKNIIGRESVRRALTGFEGVSIDAFDLRDYEEVMGHSHGDKDVMLSGVFFETLLEELGYDPEPVDREEEKQHLNSTGRPINTEATAANKEILREHAMRWSTKQETADVSDLSVEQAGVDIGLAIEKLEEVIEDLELDLDPEYSYDEQLGVRAKEALETLESIEGSILQEHGRRKRE